MRDHTEARIAALEAEVAQLRAENTRLVRDHLAMRRAVEPRTRMIRFLIRGWAPMVAIIVFVLTVILVRPF
jgi:hypothetical protein